MLALSDFPVPKHSSIQTGLKGGATSSFLSLLDQSCLKFLKNLVRKDSVGHLGQEMVSKFKI